MTTYSYFSEMQQLCFRATQAFIVLEDKGMQDFYSAAEKGFNAECNSLVCDNASAVVNHSQIENYFRLKDFVETKEREAAEKMKTA